jgi:hypothetical protein
MNINKLKINKEARKDYQQICKRKSKIDIQNTKQKQLKERATCKTKRMYLKKKIPSIVAI